MNTNTNIESPMDLIEIDYDEHRMTAQIQSDITYNLRAAINYLVIDKLLSSTKEWPSAKKYLFKPIMNKEEISQAVKFAKEILGEDETGIVNLVFDQEYLSQMYNIDLYRMGSFLQDQGYTLADLGTSYGLELQDFDPSWFNEVLRLLVQENFDKVISEDWNF